MLFLPPLAQGGRRVMVANGKFYRTGYLIWISGPFSTVFRMICY